MNNLRSRGKIRFMEQGKRIWAHVHYRGTNEYGGSLRCDEISVQAWGDYVSITFSGSSGTLSTVVMDIPKSVARTLAWALTGIVEGHTESFSKEFDE